MLAQASNKESMQNQSQQLWGAVEAIAHSRKMSLSKLARSCGFDATAFNKSKRAYPSGKLRWPSTESVVKVIKRVRMGWGDFLKMVKAT